jgi:hypothetical protein
MSDLAARDKLINHLQEQIDGYKNFLGGGLSHEESTKLRNLKGYLEEIGRGGENDLAKIDALLTRN